MRTLILIVFALFFFSCNKSETKKLPACIRETLSDDTKAGFIKTVQAQVVNGEIHFWLNTDARHLDGGELIVNSSCQTVCIMCGLCEFQECSAHYNHENWEIVWER